MTFNLNKKEVAQALNLDLETVVSICQTSLQELIIKFNDGHEARFNIYQGSEINKNI
jgi:hypothetical protein